MTPSSNHRLKEGKKTTNMEQLKKEKWVKELNPILNEWVNGIFKVCRRMKYKNPNIEIFYPPTTIIEFIDRIVAEKEKELVKYVDDMVVEKHKTCLYDQFDNGMFWAYKDIQQKLSPQSRKERKEV